MNPLFSQKLSQHINLQRVFTITLACLTLSLQACADLEGEDGFESEDKVIGGKVVRRPPGHIAGVFRPESFCTGSLIADNAILTAAHCVADEEGSTAEVEAEIEAGQFLVCLGQRDLRNCSIQNMAFVTKVSLNNYDASTLNNDIAVLKLDRKFKNVKKAKLPRNNTKVSGRTESLGYGLTSSPTIDIVTEEEIVAGDSTTLLHSLKSRVVKTSQCNKLREGLGFPNVHAGEVCIKVNANSNLCKGDSGGPTFIKGTLVAVASRVTPRIERETTVCDGSAPTVLTGVKKHLNFIRRAIR